MNKIIIVFAFILSSLSNVQSQSALTNYKIVREFDYAFALIISEDESMMAVLTNENRLEFYQLETMKLLQTVKVSRNAWLNKAFFTKGNEYLYYDYGMQTKTKYKRINISTGEKEKLECKDVPKGCSYISSMTCNDDTNLIKLTSKPLAFYYNPDKHIEMYRRFK